MMRCLVDGEPATSVPLDDRGMQYGDGLFETCAVQSGEVRFFERHLARLCEGCKRLGFPAINWQDLREEITGFVGDEQVGVLKMMLTRGSSQRGYADDENAAVRRILCLSALPEWTGNPSTAGIHVRVCHTRLAVQPQLAGLKHLNRLEQVLARREWQDDAIREGLICDMQDHIIEGTMSNLFLVCGGALQTPRLDGSGVAGIMRSVIIDLAAEAAIPLEIGALSIQDVQQADELFVCNSLIGIWPVVKIDDSGEYPVGPMTRHLQMLLRHYDDHNNNNWYAT